MNNKTKTVTAYIYEGPELGRTPKYMYCHNCVEDSLVKDVLLCDKPAENGKLLIKIVWKGKCTTCGTELTRVVYQRTKLRNFNKAIEDMLSK